MVTFEAGPDATELASALRGHEYAGRSLAANAGSYSR
jgi:hypothetical protein